MHTIPVLYSSYCCIYFFSTRIFSSAYELIGVKYEIKYTFTGTFCNCDIQKCSQLLVVLLQLASLSSGSRVPISSTYKLDLILHTVQAIGGFRHVPLCICIIFKGNNCANSDIHWYSMVNAEDSWCMLSIANLRYQRVNWHLLAFNQHEVVSKNSGTFLVICLHICTITIHDYVVRNVEFICSGYGKLL